MQSHCSNSPGGGGFLMHAHLLFGVVLCLTYVPFFPAFASQLVDHHVHLSAFADSSIDTTLLVGSLILHLAMTMVLLQQFHSYVIVTTHSIHP